MARTSYIYILYYTTDADLQMVKTLYTIVYMTCPIHWVVKAFHDDRTEYASVAPPSSGIQGMCPTCHTLDTPLIKNMVAYNCHWLVKIFIKTTWIKFYNLLYYTTDADLQIVKTLYTTVYMTCPIHWVVKAFHNDRTEYAAQLYVTCRDDIKFNLSR
jgi:hypothetical protein